MQPQPNPEQVGRQLLISEHRLERALVAHPFLTEHWIRLIFRSSTGEYATTIVPFRLISLRMYIRLVGR